MNYVIKFHIDQTIARLLKCFIVINLFFPYVIKESYRNTLFILSNLITILFIFFAMKKQNFFQSNRDKIFIYVFTILVVLYNGLCFIMNFFYHHYYIEQINKTIIFIGFIFLLLKINREYLIEYKVIRFLIKCINITIILSLIYYFLGYEAITFENLSLNIRPQGLYEDIRLTWIFGHKSTYALMLILFLSLTLKYKKLFKYKINYICTISLICFTILVTSSATALVLLVVILLSYYVSKMNFKKNIMQLFILPIGIIVFIFIGMYALGYVAESRDLASFGNRTYIYEAAFRFLRDNPIGIGKDFGFKIIYHQTGQMENLHNIFLNEMLRFSVLVGFVYLLLFICTMIFSMRRNIIYHTGIWSSCFILFSMDYCLRTEQLGIFFFIVYLICFIDD